MENEKLKNERSLSETPTWAVSTVITAMVCFGFLVHGSLQLIGKWLIRTKRKALIAALEKIKEELMLFGLLSLLMGHWTIWVSKICVKSSALSSRFYPCRAESYDTLAMPQHRNLVSFNHTVFPEHEQSTVRHEYCPEGHEPFASYESLEQLHRLLFVLGVIHVFYNFATIALAMLKIYSWRTWESQAKSMISQSLQGSSEVGTKNYRRLSTFVFHHTSHPWSQNKVLIWMLCFTRQFWSSINRADYLALRLGFISNHKLHLSYDFHSYMLRSMEDEFRDIVGISIPLWAYSILCIFVNFHGTNAYFWLSFIPAILILLVGTKLHHIVLKLALEVMDTNTCTGNQFNLRDELFWLGRPKLLLWLIQLISFQNAFEMATFIWSLWEIRGASCFMENRIFLVIRLASGITFQFWCSYITFPLYVIITQMGSKFKKSVVSESVRESLFGWRRRAERSRQRGSRANLATATSTSSLDSIVDEMSKINYAASGSNPISSMRFENVLSSQQPVCVAESEIFEQAPNDKDLYYSLSSGTLYDSYDDDGDEKQKNNSCLITPDEEF